MELATDNTWLYQDPIAEITAIKRALVLRGEEILDLSMINPDILPSSFIVDKLHEFTIKPENHRYGVSRGVRKLREAFSEKYSDKFSVVVDPEREVCATAGTKDGIIHILHSIAEPGDKVLIGVPTYPMHISAAKLARTIPVFFEMSASEEVMLLNIEKALDTTGARVLLLNFPNNPTGMMVSKGFYENLAAMTVTKGVKIINDFVYGEMGFKSNPVSLLTVRGMNPNIVESYSLSKAYSVPGWRCGAVLGSEKIIRDVARLKSHSDYGLFLPIQFAGAAILTGKQDLASAVRRQYSRRAEALVQGLNSLGWNATVPQGGASLWVPLPPEFAARGSVTVCRELLEKFHLLVTPGALYGNECESFLRFALVTSEEKIQDVLHRIAEFMKYQ